MNKWLPVLFLGIVVFFAGCVKNTSELQFKNDVVTIENYFVSNVAPYEGGETSIQFDVHNNGDRKMPYLEVDFFDIPGFKIVSSSLRCEPVGQASGSKCVFAENEIDKDALEPFDVRSVTIQLKSTEDVSSPTPHTISFAVKYIYFGSREASIPVIDGVTRKQPLTKFRLGDPSVGPIELDIDPSIEREVVVGDKTIKENWAIGGANPLPFSVKFKFKHVGTIEKVKDVNIAQYNTIFKISGLDVGGSCGDFRAFGPGATTDKFEIDGVAYQFPVEKTSYFSSTNVLVPFDVLSCTFKPKEPESLQPEYSASISAFFAYKYEFIKRQDFVVQPLPIPPTPPPTITSCISDSNSNTNCHPSSCSSYTSCSAITSCTCPAAEYSCSGSCTTPTPSPTPPTPPKHRVLVLKYFPVDSSGTKLDKSVTGIDTDLETIRKKVDTITQNGIKTFTDATRYHGYKKDAEPSIEYIMGDSKEFLSAIPVSTNRANTPGTFIPDYMKILTDVNICNYVDAQDAKEVWIWGYHYGNVEPTESNMAMGTDSKQYWNHITYGDVSNSGQINDMPTCKKTYTLYNYNYDRTLGEVLEDHGHQIEALLTWVEDDLFHNKGLFWTKFVGSDQSNLIINPGCGWTHYTPNSQKKVDEYIYDSRNRRLSDCENWKPDGTGFKTIVDCGDWGCGGLADENFKKWWMQNIPGKDNGLVYNGKQLRNWWEFIADFDEAVKKGKSLVES